MADCGDLISKEDLKNYKKAATNIEDAASSKANTYAPWDGSADQLTLTGIANKAQASVDAIIYDVGFKNVGAFEIGATVENAQETLTYDGKEWNTTAGPFPVVVDAPTPTLDTADWLDASAQSELKMAMRSANLPDSDGIQSDDTATPIPSHIYDTSAQILYATPPAARGLLVQSVANGVLNTSDGGSYNLYAAGGDLRSFGMVGDYYLPDGSVNPSPTDDTAAFQRALAFGGALNGESSACYYLRRWSFAREDQTKIDFRGAKIAWSSDGTDGNNPSGVRSNGIINCIKDQPYSSAVVSGTIAEDDYTINIDADLTGDIAVGDYVTVRTEQPTTQDGRARYEYLAYVSAITSTSISVDEPHKWGYVGDITITKRNALRGVSIKNVGMIIDLTSSTDDNAICGVSFTHTVGCGIKNINMDGQYNPVLMCLTSRDFDVSRGVSKDAKATDGGHGYYAQFGACRDVTLSGIELSRGRHVVDFTYSARATVSGCVGMDASTTDYSLHGGWEHDITFDNCYGSVGIAISGESFGETAANIACKGVTGESLFAYANSVDVSVEDCSFDKLYSNTYGLQLRRTSVLKETRFYGDSEHPYLSGYVSNAGVYGGKVVAETYSNAPFLPTGINVDFFGTHVVAYRSALTIPVEIERLNMIGGKFESGIIVPISSGSWTFDGVDLTLSQFRLQEQVLDGFTLNLYNHTQNEFISGGVVNGQITDTGISDTDGNISPVYAMSLNVSNMNLVADDIGSFAFNTNEVRNSMNLNISGLSVENGKCFIDVTDLHQGSGSAVISNVVSLTNSDINIVTDQEQKHAFTKLDLNLEFGVDERKTESPMSVTVYRLVITGGSGYLAYNYPIDAGINGLLIVTSTADKSEVSHEIVDCESGIRYRRSYINSTWTAWV